MPLLYFIPNWEILQVPVTKAELDEPSPVVVETSQLVQERLEPDGKEKGDLAEPDIPPLGSY